MPPLQPADTRGDLNHFGSESDAKTATTSDRRGRRTFCDRVDSVLLNPWAGIPVFLAVVWALFQLTTRFAPPLQNVINQIVNGPLASAITWLLGLVGLGDSWVRGPVRSASADRGLRLQSARSRGQPNPAQRPATAAHRAVDPANVVLRSADRVLAVGEHGLSTRRGHRHLRLVPD